MQTSRWKTCSCAHKCGNEHSPWREGRVHSEVDVLLAVDTNEVGWDINNLRELVSEMESRG